MIDQDKDKKLNEDVEDITKNTHIDYEEYQQLKDKKVWVRFCHADHSISPRYRASSRVEYEPILVRLGDALKLIPESKWPYSNPYQFSPEESVDGSYYMHAFATPGYPVVEVLQKGILRKLKEMGHDIYQGKQISYSNAYVRPAGEPEEEVTAPLIELWLECEHETKKLGLYTGKAYSQKQIDEAHADVEKARELLNKREIVSPESISSYLKEGNFDEIAEAIGVEEGELVWRKYLSQRYVAGEWSTEDLGIAKVVRTEKNGFQLEYPFGFPRFSADQKELKEAIESLGTAILEHHGRSGFASRNSYEVKPSEKNTEYDIKVINEMWPAYKFAARYMIEQENFHTVDYSQEDVERAYEIFAQAKELIRAQRIEKFMSKFKERSLDGVFSIISEGGYEEKVEVPEERFLECFRVKTANTQDYRQNRAHTYDVGYIDIEKVKMLARNGKLHINLPEEYMGKMIGAKGCNIKRLQEELGKIMGNEGALRIILHGKTKEELEIRLAQIQKAIKEQKNQNYVE